MKDDADSFSLSDHRHLARLSALRMIDRSLFPVSSFQYSITRSFLIARLRSTALPYLLSKPKNSVPDSTQSGTNHNERPQRYPNSSTDSSEPHTSNDSVGTSAYGATCNRTSRCLQKRSFFVVDVESLFDFTL